MIDHIIFLIYILIISSSTIGYGFIFSKLINKEYLKLNIGYQGLFGFLFLVIISSISSFFFKHDYLHNLILQIIGLIAFVYYFYSITKKDKLLFGLIFFLILISIYVYKNHDDFPYYHLTYALTLTENKFVIGLGNLGHGFRTWTLYLGIPGLILGLISPHLLLYPYKSWMALGNVLGWVNSRLILGIVFLLVLQPIAFFMKCIGYDPLRLKIKNTSSYREKKKSIDTDLTRIF